MEGRWMSGIPTEKTEKSWIKNLCQKQYSLTSKMPMASQHHPGANCPSAFPWPQWAEVPSSPLPLRRDNTWKYAKSISYGHETHTHTHRQSKCWAGSRSPAVLYLHYTLCQGVAKWRQHGDDGCLTDNRRSRLWEARALSAPAVHRSVHLPRHHAFLLHSWQP